MNEMTWRNNRGIFSWHLITYALILSRSRWFLHWPNNGHRTFQPGLFKPKLQPWTSQPQTFYHEPRTPMGSRDVSTGATIATAVTPKFSDTITLFRPYSDSAHHWRGCTKIFPVVTSLRVESSWLNGLEMKSPGLKCPDS